MMTARVPKNRYSVLVAGVIIQFCAGIIYMWSVFRDPVSIHLEWDKASASLTASVMLVAFVAGLFFGGRIADRTGPKMTCAAGSILMAAGILASSFVTPSVPYMMYITYGLIGGFGVGIAYTCTVSPIQRWFPDRRGFATGMLVGAFGFSLVIFAPLANYLLAQFGVPSTLQMFGIAFLLICPLASMFLTDPPAGYMGTGDKIQTQQKQYTAKEMLRTRQYYLITLSLFFVLPAFFILNPMFMSLGIERGLTESMAVMGVMIIGAASASGRLALTWISDHIGRFTSLLVIIGLTAAGSLVIISAQGLTFTVCLAVIAFAFGGAAGVYTAVTSDAFGSRNMGSNYGYVMLGFGASALIFPFLSNTLTENGDHTISFAMCVVTCLISFACVMLLRRYRTEA